MSRLSKAWVQPPAPVSGPSPVTQSLIGTISAQAFRIATTPRYVHLPAQKSKPVEFVPRIFPPVTLHGVVIHFNPEVLATLRAKREEVQKNIRAAQNSGLHKIHGVEIKYIVEGFSRSPLNNVRCHIDSIYDERNSTLDVGNVDFNCSYHIRTYQPCESLRPSTIFDTLILNSREKKFQSGIIKVVHTLTDPSLPCEWPGTKEFGERARAATYRLSGEACPMPCYTCSCTGKFLRGPQ